MTGPHRPLGEFLDQDVYPALYQRLDSAFPEFGWRQGTGHWTATSWPAGFPCAVEHEHPDRLMVYEDRPYWVKVHGHEGVRWLEYVSGSQQLRGAAFVDAVRRLAELAGVPLPEQPLPQEQVEAAQRVETRRAILTCIAKICHAELMRESREPARAYLRSRGLGEEHLRELQIGLYPPVAEIQQVLGRAGFTADERRGENGLWQALEGYIIFPWSDARGHLLTLYGRWPGKELPFMKDLPGWQHRRMEERATWAKKPEHERGEWQEPRVPKTIALFGEGTKASPLYFDRAWRAGQRDLVLVEGVLDAAVLHTHGDPRAIACVAAQLSGEQVETLRRYQPTSVTICLDPDGGGRRGTLSCIRYLLAAGITAYVAPTLPEGLDPDEFVLAKGLGAWETHLEGAVHALRFMARAILDEHRGDGWTDKGKTEAKTAAVAFAAGLSGQQALADLDEFYWPELVKELGVGKRELPKLAAAQRGARLAKQRDAKAKTEGAGTHRPLIANFYAMPDPENDKKVLCFEIEQAQILADMHKASGGWPRSRSGLLFTCAAPPAGTLPEAGAVHYLKNDADLFAWLRTVAELEWTGHDVLAGSRLGARRPVTGRELFEAADLLAPARYAAVELLPHQPPMPATFYACGELPEGDGAALTGFAALFNPDTPLDRDLLTAALLTPCWGGAAGTRPGFVFSSAYGRGSGKTATAEAIAEVYGGVIKLNTKTDWDTAKARMLDDNALPKRVVLLDNLKERLSSEDVESAITEKVINGKRMYHGDFERPNTLSWFLTSNVPELSGDLTDRCVVVRIGPQQHGIDFISKVADFLREHRAALICDLVSRLRQPPSCTIAPENRDRFQAWQDAVLARFANGNELARLIKERRPGVDADAGEAQEVADALAELLKSKGHCPGCEHIFIPKRVARELLQGMLGTRNETDFGRRIKQVAQNRPLRHVNAEYRHSEWRHGLDWCPPLALQRGSGKDQGRIRHLDNTPPPLLPGMPGVPGCPYCSPSQAREKLEEARDRGICDFEEEHNGKNPAHPACAASSPRPGNGVRPSARTHEVEEEPRPAACVSSVPFVTDLVGGEL